MSEQERPLADIIIEHVDKMLSAPSLPPIPQELEGNERLRNIHEYLAELRQILTSFAKGNLEMDILLRGVVAGKLKALQANILHLTWQIQQVANGDFTQRVEFMGDYSLAFNSMVEQLDSALTALRAKEEELTELTQALQHEVAQKDEALEALGKSEARFRYMADHDTLTGIFNRRSFYDMASLELDAARRKGYPCTLVMMDVDFFKRFNDTYGHLEGDEALRHVTAISQKCLRQKDIMGRYGGEEFVFLFPGTGMEDGKMVADRIRKAIAAAPVMTKQGPVSITVSMGVTHIPPEEGAKKGVPFLEEMLNIADEALYEAKRSGRNRFVIISHHSQRPGIVCEEK